MTHDEAGAFQLKLPCKLAGANNINGCVTMIFPVSKLTLSKPAEARTDQPSIKSGRRTAPYILCKFHTTASDPTCKRSVCKC